MRLKSIALGTLVAIGLFALSGSQASAQYVISGPNTAIVGGGYFGSVYSPVHQSRYVTPFASYGVPTYGYYPGAYNRGYGYSYNSGFYGNGFSGSYNRGYYGGYGRGYARPGVSFGITVIR